MVRLAELLERLDNTFYVLSSGDRLGNVLLLYDHVSVPYAAK